MLLNVMQADPTAWQKYPDVMFKLLGYKELEERAKLFLPPAIQQAIAMQSGEGANPQIIQAQALQLQMENGQLKQILTQLAQKLQSKAIEGQNKLEIEKLKLMGQMILQQMAMSGEHAGLVLQQETGAITNILDKLHEHEMAEKQAGIAREQQQEQFAQQQEMARQQAQLQPAGATQ